MDINSATAAPVGLPASSQQPQPPAQKDDRQAQEQQDSTVVKLSEQAQQLNRAENQNNNAKPAEAQPQKPAEPQPQKTAEPSGIQFLPTEIKGGKVDTFA